MALRETDLFLIGRDDDVFTYTALDLNNQYEGKFVPLTGTNEESPIVGDITFVDGKKILFGSNANGLTIKQGFWGGLFHGDQLQIEYGVNGIKMGGPVQMRIGGANYDSNSYDRNQITHLGDPSHKHDAVHKEYVDNTVSTSENDLTHLIETEITRINGDLTQYVNEELFKKVSKVGDMMTGPFMMLDDNNRNSATLNKKGDLILNANKTGNHYAFAVYTRGYDSNYSKAAFRVTGDGNVKAGYNTSQYFQAEVENDVVTKGWLENSSLTSYLPLAGGSMTGDIVFDNSHTITNLADPTNAHDAIHKEYADDKFMPYTGGNFTGIIRTNSLIKCTRPVNFAFQIKPDDLIDRAHWSTTGRIEIQMDDPMASAIRLIGGIKIKGTNAVDWDEEGNNAFISNEEHTRVYTPVLANKDVATKEYVDSVSLNGVDLSTYATETYVDEQIKHRTTQRWIHATHSAAENLVAGEFFIAENGNLYIHPTNYDGKNMGVSNTADAFTLNFMCGVHNLNGVNMYNIVASEIKFNNTDNKYIKITKSGEILINSTTPGEVYLLNIPGFTL